MWIARASKQKEGPYELISAQEYEEQIDEIIEEWQRLGFYIIKEKKDEHMLD